MTITPAMASGYLSMNTENRPISNLRVEMLADAIRRGEWKINGDVIRIAENGRLLDGQHRLRAIELSCQTVQSFVALGMNEDVFDTIDIGAKRTSADILHVAGFSNSKDAASAAKLIFYMESNGTPFSTESAPTPSQIIEIINRHPGIIQSAQPAFLGSLARKLLSPSVAVFSHYWFSRKDAAKATSFFVSLNDGVGLTKTDPVWCLRERLMAQSEKERLTKNYRLSLAFKAFKKHLRSEETKVLRVVSDERSKDLFDLDIK